MLFAYTYVPHKMEKMQEFIDFIFYEVWCKAPAGEKFGFDLFNCKPDLREVIITFHYSDTIDAEFFNSHLERIYNLFAKLKAAQINQLRAWYQANNDIEKVCSKDPATSPIRYNDFPAGLKLIKAELAAFFKKLYSHIDNAPLKKAGIGDIDDHYKIFMQTNKMGKCPFCGINDLLGEYHTKREAYDHYLPKSIYPFNSINFKNLVPACHHCNSSYKTTDDPAFTPKDPARLSHRRAVFYPYTKEAYEIEIHVELLQDNVGELTPADINLHFGPTSVNEQIETWKDVYDIEERYKAKLCTESDGKAWLVEVLDEWRWHDETAGVDGKAPDAYLRDVSRHAQKSPFANSNFLKKPFLDACQSLGLFDALP